VLAKHKTLSSRRVAKLVSIGFIWKVNEEWDVRFRQLVEYKQDVGDCNVPQQFGLNPQLGRWVHMQRLANKKQKLSKEHWEQLNSIEFYWGEQPPCARIARNDQQLETFKQPAAHPGLWDVPNERYSGSNPRPHIVHKLATADRSNNRQNHQGRSGNGKRGRSQDFG
jgi:hypothetical protein